MFYKSILKLSYTSNINYPFPIFYITGSIPAYFLFLIIHKVAAAPSMQKKEALKRNLNIKRGLEFFFGSDAVHDKMFLGSIIF